MGSQRAHIVLPEDLVHEIDSVVGPRGRSAFLVETARAELRRRRLLSFLRGNQPAWQEQHHRDLASGTETWVKNLRRESDARASTATKLKRKQTRDK